MKSKFRNNIALLVASAVLLTSCSDKYREDLNELYAAIDEINARMDSLAASVNSDIEALYSIVNALDRRDYITDVEQLTNDGVNTYLISFLKGKQITVKDGQDGKDGESGKDGSSPIVGVRQDEDGQWYWTIDGEWLLDDSGNKIRVTPYDGQDGDSSDGQDGQDGTTPLLKIENSLWYISTDGGVTWKYYGPSCGEDGRDGTDGVFADPLFADIAVSESSVVFTLTNGQIILIPMYCALDLVLSGSCTVAIAAGEQISIDYEVLGAGEDLLVECAVEGEWKAYCSEQVGNTGVLNVVAPNPYSDGKVVVFASTSDGRMSIKTISFVEKQ